MKKIRIVCRVVKIFFLVGFTKWYAFFIGSKDEINVYEVDNTW